MATITKSIGTSSRDYSTITLWEADLDDTGIYTSGDDAVGECYNDTAFDETFNINGGGGVGLNSVKLSVASGERHDGTEGSGARIVRTDTNCLTISTPSGFNQKYTVEWLEIDGNGNIGPLILGNSQQYTNVGILTNLIVHGIANGNSYLGLLYSDGRSLTIRNCVFYDVERNAGGGITGIVIDGDRTEGEISNCVVYNIYNPNTTGISTGIQIYVNSGDTVNATVKNNISMSITTGGSGSSNSYSVSFDKSVSAWDYNMSDDDTADDPGGSNNLINKSNSTQFVSTVSGSEDLHIVSTSDAVGAGEDLATTSVDINGSDRNALAATVWDIGAHQYASTASIGTSSRDYSTITLWEADLDDTTIYGAGANAVGECYNDAAFVERITLNGGITVGLSTTILTVAAGERHDGTAGTGARVETPSNWGSMFTFSNDNIPTRLEWLEFENLHSTANGMIGGAAYDYYKSLSKLLVHSTTNHPPGYISMGFWAYSVDNCIVYSQGVSGGGISINSYFTGGDIVNNTVYLDRTGISASDNPTSQVFAKNNIAIARDSNYKGFSVTGATTYPNWDSNITNGSVLYGTNTHTGITASQLFVSVVSGSEDLHLKSDAYAIGLGANLSSTSPSYSQNTVISSGYASRDIDNQNRSAFTGTTWDIGADQVYITASIGTSSRDYSTITAWEADLDDTSLYTSGDDAVGECYNDSAFDEGVTIDGGGTVGLSSVKLTAPSSERHDGTAGSGARIVASASYGTQIKCSRASLIVEWLECDGDQISSLTSYKRAIYSNTDAIIRNVILHDIYSARESFGLMTEGNSGGAKGTLLNSIIYNILSSGGTQTAIGIYIASGTSQTVICYNNTIFNISKSVNASTAIGISSNTINTLKNNIVIGTNGATTNKDFNNSGSNIAYNISSDGTASGIGSKTNQPASRQFVSTLSGSEDLHLIFKSAAIDAGVDLGTTPDGVQYDINGKDRDTENSIWDIGAHEYGDNVVFGLLRV